MPTIRSEVRLIEGYRTEARARQHTWTVDVPEPEGTDAAGTPEEMLLGALGACTAMTVRMYATRKGWPLEDVQVDLSYASLEIQRQVKLVGPLDAEQVARLLDIANRCPVHKILTKPATVVTTVVS